MDPPTAANSISSIEVDEPIVLDSEGAAEPPLDRGLLDPVT